MTANDAWEMWRDELETNHAQAKELARTLIERFIEGEQPEWTPTQRTTFLNWCDREGLLVPRLTLQHRD